MGDRANVVIDEENGGTIFLYSHWGGSELPKTLQKALAKRWRWDDEAYLARIIFDEMVADHQGTETSFGISTTPPDNEYPYLRVSTKDHTVTVDFDPVRKYHDKPNRKFGFEEFVKLKDLDWAKVGYRDAA